MSEDDGPTPYDDFQFYEYEDFPEGRGGHYIRLLSLLPETDPPYLVRCTLTQHVLLDGACPPFEALSYVWGSSKDFTFVFCDDHGIKITPSLYRALVSLRQDTPRYLWIDQLCIQQGNALEKNFQIPLMRDIYSRASRTIAWLGPADRTMNTAYEVLKRTSNAWDHYFMETIREALNSDEGANHDIVKDEMSKWGMKAPDGPEITAVKCLLYNPWFTRVWIIQEAAVSNDLVLYSGSNHITFDEVLAGILAMGELVGWTRRNDTTVEGNKLLAVLAKIRNRLHSNESDFPIVQLIADCHLFQATDDRDRFFALYGISSITKELPHVHADYTVPAANALSHAMVQLMRHENSVRLLELSDSSTQAELPSWVPRAHTTSDPRRLPQSTLNNNDEWATDAFSASIRKLCGEGVEQQCPDFDWADFDRSMSQVNEVERRFTPPRHDLPQTQDVLDIELNLDLTLSVRGQLVDRIEELAPVVLLPAGIENGYGSAPQQSRFVEDLENAMKIDSDGSWMHAAGQVGSGISVVSKFATRTISQWRDNIDALTKTDLMIMGQRKQSQYHSKDSLRRAYRDVVTGGRSVDDVLLQRTEMGDKEITSAFDAWRKTMSTSVRMNVAKQKIGLKASVGMFDMLSTSFRAHKDFNKHARIWMSHLLSPLYGRRMAWTFGGRLALVPAQTKVDDHVLYLQGSEMPFVMRLEGTTWKMIGPAYVDGLMDGELYDPDCLATIRIR